MKVRLKKQNRHEVESVNQTGIQAKSLTDIRPMDNGLVTPQKHQTEDINHQQIQKKPGFNFAEIPITGNTDRSTSRIQPKFNLSLQKKLTVGEAGDKYEQEADSVAEKVVKKINTPSGEQSTSGQGVQRQEEEDLQMKPDISSIQRQEGEEEDLQMKPDISSIQRQEGEEEDLQMKPDISSIQRQEGEEEELQMKPDISSIQRQEGEEEDLQMKPDISSIQRQEGEEEDLQMKPDISSIQRQEGEEEDLQMKPDISSIQRQEGEEEEIQAKSTQPDQQVMAGGDASTELETSIQTAKGGGQPLDGGLQRSMGQAMGADFSGVKVHTDSQSDQLNQSIQAKAFTTGQDVFFRQGAYEPSSRGGQELIAHELTHVVQQNGKSTSGSSPIQRKMKFKSENLIGTMSLGARVNKFLGRSSTFTQIQNLLTKYETANAPKDQEKLLKELLTLAQLWLDNHTDDPQKRDSLEKMIPAINEELKHIIPIIQTEALEHERDNKYKGRFAEALRKKVKREIPEGEMDSIWQTFTSAMKNNQISFPGWTKEKGSEINWGKLDYYDKEKAEGWDKTEIQLAKLEAFRKDIEFLTKLVETDQGEELQINNVTLWSDINIGRPAANNPELNKKMSVVNGGTPLNKMSMGALLDLFAVGASEGDTPDLKPDLKNVKGDLLLNDNNPYMQWGGSFNVWAAVSANFAAKATGEVHVYVPWGAKTDSVFWTAELPELQKNPAVTGIFIHELSSVGKDAVAQEKAKTIDQMEMQTILKSPQAWTTSTISGLKLNEKGGKHLGGLTVKGAGGKEGVSGGTLKKMGNKWKGYKKPEP
ncbi:eCIS core domain-containing protein [Planktothrix agardhii]|uniref:eCIS core domain-containing protein n=1 Tax=Planktothrix agardhii TaxID=1160 RepID=UPI0020A807FA|nr:DUF4157 domain-containing protein [Planktothrix agardhii]CAD5981027.1 Transcriptional regulator ICP22 homolog [Planktothrix agardhii]